MRRWVFVLFIVLFLCSGVFGADDWVSVGRGSVEVGDDVIQSKVSVGGDCVLERAYWEKEDAVGGERVDMVVESSGCLGRVAEFVIYETDGIFGRKRVDGFEAVVDEDVVRVEWVVEYEREFLGDPEYEFKVSVNPELESENLLRVAEGVVGGDYPEFYLVTSESIIINVKDAPYNAQGDGIADDTGSIQMAIDDAFSFGGGSTGVGAIVFFPSGTYLVTSVRVRDNIIYRGEDMETTIIKRPDAPIVGGQISSISRENPAVVTFSSPHELADTDQVFIQDITQGEWSDLNDISFSSIKIDDYSVALHPYRRTAGIETIIPGNPTVFKTARKHYVEAGESVRFYGIAQSQWLDLNEKSFAVTVIDNYNFEIDYDSIGYAAYNTADPGKFYRNIDTSGFSSDYRSSGSMHQQFHWRRTFTTDGVVYSSDVDSGPLVMRSLTFDGNSQNQGPYQGYEQEHASLVFLSGDKNAAGRLVVDIADCYFKDGISDGIALNSHVDVSINNCVAENVFRGGLVYAGYDAIFNVKNLTTFGDVDPTGIDFESAYESVLRFEDINLIDGDFDLSAIDSDVEMTNVYSGAPPSGFYLKGSTARFSDSTFVVGAKDAIRHPQDVVFENTTFIVSEKYSADGDNKLHGARVIWASSGYETTNGRLEFRNCRFEVGDDVEVSDNVYGIRLSNERVTNNNFLVVDNCYFSDDLDVGMDTDSRGGNWIVRNSVFASELSFWFNGFESYGVGRYFNISFSGLIFEGDSYAHIAGYSTASAGDNKLENKNIMVDESANNIFSTYGLDANEYVGGRLILGESVPTSSTHCLVGDVYRLKSPVSGQVHEWSCTDAGYVYESGSGNPSAWVELPVVDVIASFVSVPENSIFENSATFGVGGVGITHYKYKLDDGAWSGEVSVGDGIVLDDLSFDSHVVSVIGKDVSGVWQPEDRAMTYVLVVLNQMGDREVEEPGSCSSCEDCDGFFDSCGYDECKSECNVGGECYYRGAVPFFEDCVSADFACSDLIDSCGHYSDEECGADVCGLGNCEIVGGECAEIVVCDEKRVCSGSWRDCLGCGLGSGNGNCDNRNGFAGIKNLSMGNCGKDLIWVEHNFSVGDLDLDGVEIERNVSVANRSYVIVKNLEINGTKTIYLDKNLSSSNAVCVLDEEVANLSELEGGCEVIECPGSSGEVSCEDSGAVLVVSGLSYSGVIESYVAPPVSPPSGPGPGDSGGVGGTSMAPGVPVVVSNFSDANESLENVSDDQMFYFTLGEEEHSIRVIESSEDELVVEIRSEPIVVSLLRGEEKRVDVNGDGEEDIILNYEEIVNGRVSLSIEIIEKNVRYLFIIGVISSVLVVVFGILVFVFFKLRKTEEEERVLEKTEKRLEKKLEGKKDL